MADFNWDSETVDTVRKYAMQNTVEYDGAGQSGSVLGRLLGERADLRPRAKELKSLVKKEVEAANQMAKENGVDAVRESLSRNKSELWKDKNNRRDLDLNHYQMQLKEK